MEDMDLKTPKKGSKKSKPKKSLIIVVAFIVLVLLGVGAYLAFFTGGSSNQPPSLNVKSNTFQGYIGAEVAVVMQLASGDTLSLTGEFLRPEEEDLLDSDDIDLLSVTYDEYGEFVVPSGGMVMLVDGHGEPEAGERTSVFDRSVLTEDNLCFTATWEPQNVDTDDPNSLKPYVLSPGSIYESAGITTVPFDHAVGENVIQSVFCGTEAFDDDGELIEGKINAVDVNMYGVVDGTVEAEHMTWDYANAQPDFWYLEWVNDQELTDMVNSCTDEFDTIWTQKNLAILGGFEEADLDDFSMNGSYHIAWINTSDEWEGCGAAPVIPDDPEPTDYVETAEASEDKKSITLTFDEEITIVGTDDVITVTDEDGNEVEFVSMELDATDKVLTIGFENPLEDGTYTVTINEGAVTDADGEEVVDEVEVMVGEEEVDSENPDDVLSLNATAGDGEVTLDWHHAGDNVGTTGYIVHSGPVSVNEPGDVYESTVDAGDVLTYTVTGLDNDKEYFFSVIAYDAAGNESMSWAPEASATPSVWTIAGIPVLETLTSVDGDIVVTWGEVADAVSYEVAYRTPGADNMSEAMTKVSTPEGATTLTLTQADDGILSGNDYWINIRAYNAAGVASAYTVKASVRSLLDIAVTAELVDGDIKVNWTDVTGTVTYVITYHDVDTLDILQKQITDGSTELTLGEGEGIVEGKTYAIIVKAYDSDGPITDFSESVEVEVPTTPEVITLAGELVGADIKLSWNEITGATYYHVVYGELAAVPNNAVNVNGQSATLSSTDGIERGKTYSISIQAFDADGAITSTALNVTVEVPAVPSTPTNVQASTGADGVVDLTWDPIVGAEEIILYYVTQEAMDSCPAEEQSFYACQGFPSTNTVIEDLAATSGQVTDLLPGVEYRFLLVAFYTDPDGVSKSVHAAELNATAGGTAAVVLDVPGAPTARGTGYNNILVTWEAVTGADEYVIEWGEAPETLDKSPVSQSTGTSFQFTESKGLEAGTKYYFRIKARDADGNESAYTSVISAKTFVAQSVPDTTAVYLANVGTTKVAVIKALREATGLGLAEAKALVDAAPGVLIEDLPITEMAAIKEKFREAGAEVEFIQDIIIEGLQEENQKVEIIKQIRELSGLGLKETKEVYEKVETGTPFTASEDMDSDEAQEIKRALEGFGAVARLR